MLHARAFIFFLILATQPGWAAKRKSRLTRCELVLTSALVSGALSGAGTAVYFKKAFPPPATQPIRYYLGSEGRLPNPVFGARDQEIEGYFAKRGLPLPRTRIRVLFIPQVHSATLGELSSAEKRNSAGWHRELGDYILRHPGAYFIEGDTVPLFPISTMRTTVQFPDRKQPYSGPELVARIRQIFPQGWPAAGSTLSDEQVKFLYTDGAPRALWMLGRLDRTYAPEDREILDRAIKFVAQAKAEGVENLRQWVEQHADAKAVINTERELEGLARMARFKASPDFWAGEDPHYILGWSHQLESYNGKYFEVVVVDPSVD